MAKQIVSSTPAKKAPPMPRKAPPVVQAAPVAPPKGPAVRKGPPPMKAAPTVVQAPATAVVQAPKRGPGRPPKTAPSTVIATEQGNGAPTLTSLLPKEALDLINSLKGEIAAMSSKLSKATTAKGHHTLTAEEAAKEGNELPESDWRAPYAGVVAKIQAFFQKGESMKIQPNHTWDRCLLALPQDSDINGEQARCQGALALYTTRRGDVFVGPAIYVYSDELEQIYLGGAD